MLKNTFPCSNNRHVSHIRQLPHILKINLHTKLDDGKDPKSKIDDKTKDELKKDLKCEIDDKTKNELKKNIKSELEKDLKFEIGDKTKNELKEKIKNELEKDLKFELDDKTKNELKDKIKKEIKDEIDCKCDKNGFNKDGYDKDGYDKNGFDKDGYDKDGYDRTGFDKDGKKKGDENEVEQTAFIVSQEITQDHADIAKCGSAAGYYKSYNQVGRQGFSTSDLLKEFYPEMYSNPKIAEHLEMGSKVFYGAVNYKFAFSEPFDYSWANASNMWCKKCSDNSSEIACQDDEIKSFCYPAGYYANQDCNKSFFAEKACPNLVKVSGADTIKAKQVAPLILVDSSGQMIDKDGNNTKIYYSSLSPYLNANGHIKDCAGDAKCKNFAEIMKKVAWDSDKEVLLTVSGDLQKANPYYYDNEDNSVSVDTNFV
ncbi:hypothetical protein [Wolbachia endosymbiont of Oedothorax gibbosus]|uniref:hypothetical protein n=1 Tax=Wolbachia endosymbiont of Oedothorax gibbosus TaxID=931100 RepID=UPI002024752A|nr:hypothetical protein [Wolbachia endosymbiont of Oedothorax gibbosus]